jgi:dihydrofolate reductase
MEVLAFLATSLDGYIARNDDSLDWLDEANKRVPKGEDFGYKKFFDSVDLLVMGRATFEKALTFDEWPYGEKRVIVLSSKPISIPKLLEKTVSSYNLTPKELTKKLSEEQIEAIYVDGGNTIQRFISSNLLDEITITVIPVLLGAGKPLFANLEGDIAFELVRSKAYSFGYVQSTYKIKKKKK